MGRNNKKKSNRSKTKSTVVAPILIPVEKKKNVFLKFWNQVTFAWKIAGVIFILASALATYFSIGDHYKTPHEKYVDENLPQGDFETSKIKNGQIAPYTTLDIPPNFKIPKIHIGPSIGGIYVDTVKHKQGLYISINQTLYHCPISGLEKGINLFANSFNNCTGSSLSICLKNDRLFVSTEFKDIETEQIIGVVEYNHWTLYKPNFFNYLPGKNGLEVIDRYHHIVFSVQFFDEGNIVFISGYFISLDNIMIVRNPLLKDSIMNGSNYHFAQNQPTICIPKTANNWKHTAIKYIEQIQSVF